MKQLLKKIYTILILIKNVLIRKSEYNLHFVAENDPPIKRWYYDFKHWGFKHGNLEMVAGADALCELYANGKDDVTVNIICKNKPITYSTTIYDEFIAETPNESMSWKDKIIYGRNYIHIDPNDENKITTMWICPVTLFVLGRYPKHIYIKKQ
jgi:hypothetical protein